MNTDTEAESSELLLREEFCGLFKLADEPPYENRVWLTDAPCGFSVTRNYDEDGLLFSPAVNTRGTADTVALLHVVTDLDRAESGRAPLRLRIGSHSLYSRKGRSEERSPTHPSAPTPESLASSESSLKPMELELADEYSIQLNPPLVLNEQGEVVDGRAVLDYLFGSHCDTAHRRRGRKVRAQEKLRNVSWRSVRVAQIVATALLQNALGRNVAAETDLGSPDIWGAKVEVDESTPVNVFGFPTHRQVATSACFLLLLYALWVQLFGNGQGVLAAIISQSLVYGVAAFVAIVTILEYVVAPLFQSLLPRLRDLRWHLQFRPLKVSTRPKP